MSDMPTISGKVVVRFLKNDLIHNVVYCAGEIAGFDSWVADRLIKKEYAVLHGDGKPKVSGGRIPLAKDYFDEPALEAHVAQLKKNGQWPSALDKPVEIGQPKIVVSTQYG